MNAQERSMVARAAALTRWAKEPDTVAATEKARKAAFDKFEREVDPEGVLSPEERAKRAQRLRAAHMTTIARKSAAARRRKAARDKQDAARRAA